MGHRCTTIKVLHSLARLNSYRRVCFVLFCNSDFWILTSAACHPFFTPQKRILSSPCQPQHLAHSQFIARITLQQKTEMTANSPNFDARPTSLSLHFPSVAPLNSDKTRRVSPPNLGPPAQCQISNPIHETYRQILRPFVQPEQTKMPPGRLEPQFSETSSEYPGTMIKQQSAM